MDICCLFYHPVPLICLIIKDWPGNEAGGRLAKQTIPNTVIVTGGTSQIQFGRSSLQGTRVFYLKRDQKSTLTLQVQVEDKRLLLH